MTDTAFINDRIQKAQQAQEKARSAFDHLSVEQLNWKPSPKSWSIAQCLDHLCIAVGWYFDDLEKIITGNYKMSFWEKHSPFTALCGRFFKDILQEDVKRKVPAPKKIQPSKSEINGDILERYHQHLDTFTHYIDKCRNVDLDKIIITSPFVSFITYSLRDTIYFLVTHEHRHINQGIRVKMNEHFPK